MQTRVFLYVIPTPLHVRTLRSELLGPHWKEYKHYKENPWVEMVDNAKMRPDVIIDPEK